MDKNLQDLENRLAGLVPRAVSDEGARALEDEIDRLAEGVESGGSAKRRSWLWPGVGAAACLALGIVLAPFERNERPIATFDTPGAETVELVSLSRQVTEVSDSDWVLGDGSETPYRYRSYTVTGMEEFFDDESGLSVTVISESEERVPLVLTQL